MVKKEEKKEGMEWRNERKREGRVDERRNGVEGMKREGSSQILEKR